MKMTRKQVADLLLKANDDFRNVEVLTVVSGNWFDTDIDNAEELLKQIIMGFVFRIKDNAIKKLSIDLYDKIFEHKDVKGLTMKIDGLNFERNMITINNSTYTIDYFNERWKIYEGDK